LDADHGPRSRATIDPTVPARNTIPKPTAERPVLKDRTGRYVVEIRDATGASLMLTAAEWTDSERKVAMSAILRLVGFKAAAPATRKASRARSGEGPSAKAPQKK
jgi:hypothetical protein